MRRAARCVAIGEWLATRSDAYHVPPYTGPLPFKRVENPGIVCDLIEAAAKYFNLPTKAIFARSKAYRLVYPRWVVMYLARRYGNCTLSCIARTLGKDRDTIRHGIKMARARIDADPHFAFCVGEVARMAVKGSQAKR